MNHISSYSTIYALGHRAINQLLSGPVVVEEKVDGSQFSMQRIGGELSCRSKGQDLIVDAPEKMFALAIETASKLDLKDGWIYRCEYLQKPKHNTLAYSRVPKAHLVVYDIDTGLQSYLDPVAKGDEALRIGLECVPLIYTGIVSTLNDVKTMIERESFLGGCPIEGVVIKNYGLFTDDKKVAMAKMVCDGFKEKNTENWKSTNPGRKDVVAVIIAALRTEARWQKAVQHLRERGELTESLKDIGPLMKEAQADIRKEESEWIAEQLAKYFMDGIVRGAISGLPEWYKDELAKSAFQEPVQA